MRYIDWNDMSELGLICRINREILHPMGLAIARSPHTGASDGVVISDDGEFYYGEGDDNDTLTDQEIKQKIPNLARDS